MQFIFRSFIFISAFIVFVPASTFAQQCITVSCAQTPQVQWSHTGSVAQESCRVSSGSNNNPVSSACNSGTPPNNWVPVPRPGPGQPVTYSFNARDTQQNLITPVPSACFQLQAGLNCANQCRDGIDNDLTGGIDQADLSCTCPTGSATAGGANIANPRNSESFK